MPVTPRVAVVTDSTASLPPDLVAKAGLGVVPLQVVVDSTSGAEGVDVSAEDVVRALSTRGVQVTTSRPSPAVLAAAYAEAAERVGARAVVAVHLSSELSGTVEGARLAASALGDLDVRVVDSRLIAMGLGFSALAAAEAAARGLDADEVVAAAERRTARTRVLLYADTLEHLRRGGRIGAAAHLLGSALAVKPLLHVVDGETTLLEKVRTAGRAVARLEDVAVEEAGDSRVDLVVHHLAAPDRAQALSQRLGRRIPDVRSLRVLEVSAAVGAHTGPGCLGVVVSRV